jgi:hypothetical protein
MFEFADGNGSSHSAGGAVLIEGRWQPFSDSFHRNDSELVTSFHRQTLGLGCCLFDPDFRSMTGCDEDSNQHICLDPVGIPIRNRCHPRSRCACALCNRCMGQPPGLTDLGQDDGEFQPKLHFSGICRGQTQRLLQVFGCHNRHSFAGSTRCHWKSCSRKA